MPFNIAKSLPFTAVTLLIGICSTMLLLQMPAMPWIIFILGCACFLICIPWQRFMFFLGVFSLGFGLMAYQIQHHLAHALPKALEAQKITLIGTISSVVEEGKKPKTKFIFKVKNLRDISANWQLPANIQLTWNKTPTNLAPGDTWRLQVKLKRPRNFANHGSFDSERFYFQQRVVALGYVVDSKDNTLLQHETWAQPINRWRQNVLRTIHCSLKDHQFANVITALAIGVKGSMSDLQTEVLQNTGTAHLLAISGLHIGLLVAICFWIINTLWRFAPRSWLVLPAPWVAACSALIVSFGYALLAGFAIATQRALIMVVVFLSGILFKRKISRLHSFCLALILVLLWDPFAVLALGFWFSFIAVGFLLYAMRGHAHWLKPQIVIACALLPLNLLFFGKSAIIGPIANSVAIPWVGIAVLPFMLFAILLLPFVPSLSTLLFKLSAHSFACVWPLLVKLAALPPYAWQLPTKYLDLIIIFAVCGTICLLIPRGLPGRWWGIFGMLPLFFVQSNAIPYGQAEFTLLDVGQGLASVLRTQNHVLVYDTGAKLNDNFDLGSRVVAPYLQAVGIKQIDTLMISHADNDHIGGAPGLMHKITTKAVVTSDQQSLPQYKPITCNAGQYWEWDGVVFTVLHPHDATFNNKRNDQSCVLMVQAGEHKILLTGDIEKYSEKQLIARYGSKLQADLMLVPHHGSKTSSSLEFLQTVRPKYALIPVGYKNQYGHPKEPVLQRYRDLDIAVLRTEYDGAISFRLGRDLTPHCYRWEQQRFWLN